MDDTSAGDQPSGAPARLLAEFSTFYTASVPRLVTFLICHGATLPDAADCVQETLIDLSPPVWSTVENPYAWCRSLAYRKLCALWSRGAPTASDPDPARSPLIAPDHDLDLGDHHQDLRYWLDQLDGDRQRAVLVCTYDGATVAEIADLLDMAPAAVRSTLRDARESLRRVRNRSPLGGERGER